MNFLFAPDSFKGSMSSEHVIELLSIAAKKVFPDCNIIKVPMADGGEGTIKALVQAKNGKIEYCTVRNPLWDNVKAQFGILDEYTVVIEMAEASGLTLIEDDRKDPGLTTSYGTGELIKEALKQGYKNILVTIGGSATNDGGMGAATALGIRFLDTNGCLVNPIGENLINVKSIDLSKMYPLLKEAQITIMSDVKNKLLGKQGATYIYGVQKGGDNEKLNSLELGMKNYANVIRKKCGRDIAGIEGSGAAGGFSVPFLAFTNAKIASGIETVLKIINFSNFLNNVDLVVTGEGRIDHQSSCGKVLYGVGITCKEKGIPVVAIVGGVGDGASEIFEYGVESYMTTVNAAMSLTDALKKTDELFLDGAERMFRLIKVGTYMNIHKRGG